MKSIQKDDLMIVLSYYGDKYSFELDDFKELLDRYGDDYYISDGRWIKTDDNNDMAELRAKHVDTSIAYICDGKSCEGCQTGKSTYCYHTLDIHHAINFEEIEPGKFAEKREEEWRWSK